MRRVMHRLAVVAFVPALAVIADCVTSICPPPFTEPAFGGTWRGGGIEFVVGHHHGTNLCDEPVGLIVAHGRNEMPDPGWHLFTGSGEVRPAGTVGLTGHIWLEAFGDAGLSAKVTMRRDGNIIEATIEYTTIGGAERIEDAVLIRQ